MPGTQYLELFVALGMQWFYPLCVGTRIHGQDERGALSFGGLDGMGVCSWGTAVETVQAQVLLVMTWNVTG
jgi:hypothetical protein